MAGLTDARSHGAGWAGQRGRCRTTLCGQAPRGGDLAARQGPTLLSVATVTLSPARQRPVLRGQGSHPNSHLPKKSFLCGLPVAVGSAGVGRGLASLPPPCPFPGLILTSPPSDRHGGWGLRAPGLPQSRLCYLASCVTSGRVPCVWSLCVSLAGSAFLA